MSESPMAPQDGGLLPPGSVVELEIYHCVMRVDGVETPVLTVTCDTLKAMLVLKASGAMDTFKSHGIEAGTPQFFAELATAFKLMCHNNPSNLWTLMWHDMLDRRLLSIVRLEIQPTQGGTP